MTGKQRSILKGLANGISPVVSIGTAGVTDNVMKAIDDYLSANELIKVSIQQGVELDSKDVCNQIAEALGGEFVQAVGRRFVIYRKAKNPKNRKIEL